MERVHAWLQCQIHYPWSDRGSVGCRMCVKRRLSGTSSSRPYFSRCRRPVELPVLLSCQQSSCWSTTSRSASKTLHVLNLKSHKVSEDFSFARPATAPLRQSLVRSTGMMEVSDKMFVSLESLWPLLLVQGTVWLNIRRPTILEGRQTNTRGQGESNLFTSAALSARGVQGTVWFS